MRTAAVHDVAPPCDATADCTRHGAQPQLVAPVGHRCSTCNRLLLPVRFEAHWLLLNYVSVGKTGMVLVYLGCKRSGYPDSRMFLYVYLLNEFFIS